MWDPAAFPRESRFAPELSFSGDLELTTDGHESTVWRYEIRTLSKSERGAEETVQGLSVTPLWSSQLGEARLRFEVGRPAPKT
jgi:hypothetical protein